MKRILVVDDNPVNRKLAAAMLRKGGWEVEDAENGTIALEKLAANTYQAVLLDISMPGIGGEDVCRQIRANESLKGLRVVAYTAHAMESEKQTIMSAGFDDIVIKPVTMEALLAKFPD